jgi:hypothetical protein
MHLRDLLEARLRLGEINPSDLHAVADDLLSQGEDSDELIALFALDRDQRWEGAKAFENLLRAWGGGQLSRSEAAPLVERDVAQRLLDFSVSALDALSRLNVICHRTGLRVRRPLPVG